MALQGINDGTSSFPDEVIVQIDKEEPDLIPNWISTICTNRARNWLERFPSNFLLCPTRQPQGPGETVLALVDQGRSISCAVAGIEKIMNSGRHGSAPCADFGPETRPTQGDS
jgi:hypothetical protein